MTERMTVTLSGSGDVGTIGAHRFAYASPHGFRVDVWARDSHEADEGAAAFGRAIETTLRPIPADGAPEADETISAGVVWLFGTPAHAETRHRLGFNVYVGMERQLADILEERRQLGVPSSVPLPYPFERDRP